MGSGSGSLLITRRLWGNAPRRNSPRQSRPFCCLRSPHLSACCGMRGLLSTLSALSSCPLSVVAVVRCPICLLHASHSARSRAHKWVFYLDCCALLWACQCRHPLRTTQSVTRSGCQSLLSSSSGIPGHLGPFAPRAARLFPPTLFRSSGPGRADAHGLDARADGETTLARRAIGGPMSFCLCLSRPPGLLGTHHTCEEDDSRDRCQVERGSRVQGPRPPIPGKPTGNQTSKPCCLSASLHHHTPFSL